MNKVFSDGKIAYFDYLRVFAILGIMVLHAASYSWYKAPVGESSWMILNAFKGLTDHMVLLFAMISGALFLGRDIPLKKLYGKYILRMVISLVVWSLIYAIASPNASNGVRAVINTALNSHYHLWFIPMIAGFYICQPILRKAFESEKVLKYFIITAFAVVFLIPQIIGLVTDFAGEGAAYYAKVINDRFAELNIYAVGGYGLYFAGGYYLNKTDIPKKPRIIIYILGIVGIFATVLLTSLHCKMQGMPVDTYHENFNISVLMTAAATFVFFKYNVKKESHFIGKLASYSFGAYLVHALVFELADRFFGINALQGNPVIMVIAMAAGCAVISYAVSALLNLIPGVRKYMV